SSSGFGPIAPAPASTCPRDRPERGAPAGGRFDTGPAGVSLTPIVGAVVEKPWPLLATVGVDAADAAPADLVALNLPGLPTLSPAAGAALWPPLAALGLEAGGLVAFI